MRSDKDREEEKRSMYEIISASQPDFSNETDFFYIKVVSSPRTFQSEYFKLILVLFVSAVLCHDVIVIFMFIELVKNPPPLQPHPERLAITYNP